MDLSRLMLGTVQFGMPYGIANRTGQPSYADVLAMLTAAAEGGITALDTAPSYGESEVVLGRALQELGLAEQMTVVTKIGHLTSEQAADPAAAEHAIRESVDASRLRLRLETLPLVLFHRESDFACMHVLETLRDEGKVRCAGVSGGASPGPVADMVRSGRVQALQLPVNVLDRRHQAAGVLAEAASRGVAVFVRSVYLQGLVLMPEPDVPAVLRPAIPVRRRLEQVAAQAGVSMVELAMRYVLSLAGVTSVLIGVETIEQLRENLRLVGRGPLPADVMVAVEQVIPDLPEEVVTPPLWPWNRG